MTTEEHFKAKINAEVGQYDTIQVLWEGRAALVFTTMGDGASGGRQVGYIGFGPRLSQAGVYGYNLLAEWLGAVDDGSWEKDERSVNFSARGTQRPNDDYWFNVFEALIETAVAEMAQHVG